MTHLDPNVDQLILQVFFFPLDGIFPPFIKHAESTVPPWFSDCQFFFCWGGWGVGGGELSYLEDLVVDVWTWKTFFEKRHINNAYSMKNSCNSCFAFCRASFLLFRHISYRTCNDRQLQQWARHVMKIRHRSRDLQMLLLGKRSLWTSMLSWIILLRWLQPKQWFFFLWGNLSCQDMCVCRRRQALMFDLLGKVRGLVGVGCCMFTFHPKPCYELILQKRLGLAASIFKC